MLINLPLVPSLFGKREMGVFLKISLLPNKLETSGNYVPNGYAMDIHQQNEIKR